MTYVHMYMCCDCVTISNAVHIGIELECMYANNIASECAHGSEIHVL